MVISTFYVHVTLCIKKLMSASEDKLKRLLKLRYGDFRAVIVRQLRTIFI